MIKKPKYKIGDLVIFSPYDSLNDFYAQGKIMGGVISIDKSGGEWLYLIEGVYRNDKIKESKIIYKL